MLRQVTFIPDELSLAKSAREQTKGRDVLFHGTRRPKAIMRTGMMLQSECAFPAVSFTRSPEVAAYFAFLEGDADEERGAILLFDRQSLGSRYRVEAHHDGIWDEDRGRRDENEELVWDRAITDVHRHLIACVMEPARTPHPETMRGRRQFERMMEQRIRILYGVSPARVGSLWRSPQQGPLGAAR